MIVDSALRLAAARAWGEISLADIASDAGITLAELYQIYPNRHAILEAVMHDIDRSMLAGEIDLADTPRDRLFEVLMRRFDALGRCRPLLRDTAKGLRRGRPDAIATGLTALCRTRRAMIWALEAAGLPASGVSGAIRAKALGVAYLGVLRVWLRDQSTDLSQTMAALDKALARLEPFLRAPGRNRPADPVPDSSAAA